MRKKSREERNLDAMIEATYYRTCAGIQINIMDIPKVFREGRRALAAGEPLDVAIPAFVATLR